MSEEYTVATEEELEYEATIARLQAQNRDLLAALEREHEALGCETDVTGQPCETCAAIAAARSDA